MPAAILAAPAAAPSPAPAPIFTCRLGAASATVTRGAGGALVYRYVERGRPGLTITGSAVRGNLFQRIGSYAATEYQLRFANGGYSYVLYSMASSARAGSSPVSGLVVLRGMKRIVDRPCRPFAAFANTGVFAGLPEDGEAYSAM